MRILQFVPTIFIIVLVNWLIVNLSPADPAVALAGEMAPPEVIEKLREVYGLNKPLIEQLLIYLSKVLRGNLGTSLTYGGVPVVDLIISRIPNTLVLALPAHALGFAIGMPLGVYLGYHFPSKKDTFGSLTALASYSMPSFLSGLFLLIAFGYYLDLFPMGGMATVWPKKQGLELLLDVSYHAVLPIITLALYSIPVYMRVTRANAIEILQEDFITTARALGLNERSIIFKHTLRNALLPTITLFGLNLGFALSGAMVTETVFAWPGLGRLLYESILHRDYPLLSGLFIFSSVLVVVASFITDIIYGYLDPRIKVAASK